MPRRFPGREVAYLDVSKAIGPDEVGATVFPATHDLEEPDILSDRLATSSRSGFRERRSGRWSSSRPSLLSWGRPS